MILYDNYLDFMIMLDEGTTLHEQHLHPFSLSDMKYSLFLRTVKTCNKNDH